MSKLNFHRFFFTLKMGQFLDGVWQWDKSHWFKGYVYSFVPESLKQFMSHITFQKLSVYHSKVLYKILTH